MTTVCRLMIGMKGSWRECGLPARRSGLCIYHEVWTANQTLKNIPEVPRERFAGQ